MENVRKLNENGASKVTSCEACLGDSVVFYSTT